jgi:hypothetical protein
MRGSPELLIWRVSAIPFKKRFPHRFLPSSRALGQCTPISNVSTGCPQHPSDVAKSNPCSSLEDL